MRKIILFILSFFVFSVFCSEQLLADNDTVEIVRYYGEAYEVGDSVITYSGIFKFKQSGTTSDTTVYIITFEPINTSSQSCEVHILGKKMLHTANDTIITLNVSDTEMDFYKWYPLDSADKSNMIGSDNAKSIKIKVHPQDTAVYILQTMKEESDNIVYNGDFSEGNKGFWTDYTYTTEAKVINDYSYGLGPEGRYAVGDNPYYYHQNFCNYSGSSNGKMFIANGNQGTDKIVYAATFDVEPNENYIVSFEASTLASCASDELPKLQFSVSGEKLGSVFKTSFTTCSWGQYYQIWNSGSHTNAMITILNQNTKANGNDFAIDNITYRKMCTSYDTVVIINDVTLYDTVKSTICENGACFWKGEQITEAGFYTDSLKTSDGVDSLVTLWLTVYPSYEITIDTIICEGQSVVFNNQTISDAGTYTAKFQTIRGCDSTVYLNLEVITTSYDTVMAEIDSWQDYVFYGDTLHSSGQYRKELSSEAGCEQVVILYLTINDKIYINGFVCDGDEYIFGDKVLTTSGVYLDTLQAQNGNDSIVVLSLEVMPLYDDTIYGTIVEGQSYGRSGFFESQEGVYTHTGTSVYGCDSSIVLVLTVLESVDIWTPTAFTPTTDDNNRFFVLFSKENVVVKYFRIFNRWGTLLYESKDTAQGWDGTYNGQICEQGVYSFDVMYYLEGERGKAYRKTGEFLLMH